MDLIKNHEMLGAYAGDDAAGLLCRSLEAAVRAVHPASCIGRYLESDSGRKFVSSVRDTETLCIGGGKAAAQMVEALTGYGLTFAGGNVNCGRDGSIGGIALRKCMHPLPDGVTVKNTIELMDMVTGSEDAAQVTCLLSGGASSMLCAPLDFVGLGRVRAISGRLISAGANISEINCVRRHLSKIKGGKLSRLCNPRRVHSLIISDVTDNRLEDIGSGPTAADPTTARDALAVMKKYDAQDLLGDAEEELLSGRHETVKDGEASLRLTANVIIADNSVAVASAVAAALREGCRAAASDRCLTGDVYDEAFSFVHAARNSIRGRGIYAAGGEVLVRVTGNEKGGRCQHFALACAGHLKKGEYVAAFATDGRDGNTSAAGGLISAAEDTSAYLESFSSGAYFDRNRNAIIMGDTGTNVADVYLYFNEGDGAAN